MWSSPFEMKSTKKIERVRVTAHSSQPSPSVCVLFQFQFIRDLWRFLFIIVPLVSSCCVSSFSQDRLFSSSIHFIFSIQNCRLSSASLFTHRFRISDFVVQAFVSHILRVSCIDSLNGPSRRRSQQPLSSHTHTRSVITEWAKIGLSRNQSVSLAVVSYSQIHQILCALQTDTIHCSWDAEHLRWIAVGRR